MGNIHFPPDFLMYNMLWKKAGGGMMERCERLETCSFYNEKLKTLPAMAAGFKRMYCYKQVPKCARYKVFKSCSADAVPVELFPNDFETADGIIRRLSARI